MRALPCIALSFLLAAGIAQAAKIQVDVTTATQNTDGTAITAISQVRITWGPCVSGAKTGDSSSAQASVQAQSVFATAGANATPGAIVVLYAFPVGLSPVCLLAYNSEATVESAATNVLVYTPPTSPGQPTKLGQPVILSFNLGVPHVEDHPPK